MWGMDRRRQKIALPVASKAEDTLKTLWVTKDTSGHVCWSDSPSKSCAESPLDGSDSEDSAVSGPSSPPAALHSLRCRKCERLFSEMRRQGPPRKKQRDSDPASLSCDEWLLYKTWQPQRRQQSRGRLWVHLKRIRLRAQKQLDDDLVNKALLCSRPHVFLQRNLRRCKKMFGKPSKSKTKPLHQRRNRKPTWPLRSGKYQRRKKRKSSESDGTSEHLSPVDLSITTISKDDLPADDNTLHEGLHRQEKVPKKQSVSDVSGFVDRQANCSGLEGTRRVLKFDASPSVVLAETQKPKHHLARKNAGEKLHEGQAGFTVRNEDRLRRLDEVLCEDLEVFRTPTDLCSADLKISRKSRPSRPFGARKDTFRTMLAALGQVHNQIIKESHH